MKKINNSLLKICLIIISFCFTLPSIIYYILNKSVMSFDGKLEFQFLLSENLSRNFQTIIYCILVALFVLLYCFILKKRNTIFKNEKSVFKFILLISVLFVFVIPFWSSDIFYYLGIGRLGGFYHQNPYYTDIRSFIDNSGIDYIKDTIITKGYMNVWSGTTVVYGPVWTIICSVIGLLSLGNLDFGLFIFKLFNLAVHLGNCYLLYKISRNKLFPLMYGLNPFVLIEGIANVHNDIWVVFFMLLAIYFLIKKKKIVLPILFLALATDIKYFSILLLPILVLYRFKNEDLKNRIIRCIQFGLLFLIFAGIPYLFFIRDINVFLGLITQRERYAKGLYLTISLIAKDSDILIANLKNISFIAFCICYIINCVALLLNKKISFLKEMRSIYGFVLVFLFLLLTNFQPWYFIWLSVFLIWQKPNNIKLINQMQLLTLVANIVFLIYSENYVYGPIYFCLFVIGIVMCVFFNTTLTIIKRSKCLKK